MNITYKCEQCQSWSDFSLDNDMSENVVRLCPVCLGIGNETALDSDNIVGVWHPEEGITVQ